MYNIYLFYTMKTCMILYFRLDAALLHFKNCYRYLRYRNEITSILFDFNRDSSFSISE